MSVTYLVLAEVINHLHSISDSLSDFEPESQMHKDYLDNLALIAKVESLKSSLGERI